MGYIIAVQVDGAIRYAEEMQSFQAAYEAGVMALEGTHCNIGSDARIFTEESEEVFAFPTRGEECEVPAMLDRELSGLSYVALYQKDGIFHKGPILTRYFQDAKEELREAFGGEVLEETMEDGQIFYKGKSVYQMPDREPPQRYTLAELEAKETIRTSHHVEVKVEGEDKYGKFAVSLSRQKVEDGALYDNQVIAQRLHDGDWIVMDEYRAK